MTGVFCFYHNVGKKKEQVLGPVPNWSGKRDSNPRPRPWQGRALPTELFPLKPAVSTVFAEPVMRILASFKSLSMQFFIFCHQVDIFYPSAQT
jgi:hypothetical protein